ISQNPAANQTSTEGWIVDVAESTGPNPGTVPFVQWLPQADAEAALSAAGYVTGNVAIDSHNVIPAGSVISQAPGDDVVLAAGSPVDLIVSSGPAGTAPIVVPDVVGLSQAAAENTITSTGLNVSVSTVASDTVPAGNVISQTPAGGIEVTAGSVVNLVVSSGPAPVNVTVPDVVNISQAAAESAITSAGLVVGNVTTSNSDTIAAGNVISQNPTGGSSVGEGSTVDLVVSSGPAPVVITVPNVEGLSQAAAESAITSAGLTVGTITTANSSTVAAGNVISQTPAGGTSISEGSSVDLVVSSGPVIVTVPSVIGLSQASAQSTITSAGLTIGNITTASSETVAAGNVISQSPTGGSSVEEGSSVDLVVSTGPALVTVPDVVGSSYSTAVTAIENAGLVVGSVSTVTTRRSCGRVRSQTPSGGANVAPGTAVDLVVTRTRFCNPL
ncbi:PASTA domain-containing protein, partial [Kaarinaea lacus]